MNLVVTCCSLIKVKVCTQQINKNSILLKLLQKGIFESNPAILGRLIGLASCLRLFPNLNMLSFVFLKVKNYKRWISLNTVVRILGTFYKITTVCFNGLAQLYIIILASYISKKIFKKGK